MKKILIKLLAVISVSGIIIGNAVSYAYEELTETSENAAEILDAIGIVEPVKNMSLKVTRAEFAGLMADMSVIGELSAGRSVSPFTDVTKSNPYYNQICWMYDMGYSSGNEYNAYEPERNITYTEAVKIIVDILGYHINAEKQGGYPSGYLKEAYRIGAAEGVNAGVNDELTYEQVYRLMLSALETKPFMEFLVGPVDDDNKTLLYRNFNIRKIKGVVTSDGRTAIEGGRVCAYGDIAIDDVFYKQVDGSFDEYIGCNIWAYVSEDEIDGKTVFYVYPYKTERIILQSEEIDSIENGEVNYSPDGGDTTKRLRLASGFDFIYNYKAGSFTDYAELIPVSGYAEFTDNNDDGEFDVVRTFERQNMVIDYIDTESSILYNKQNGKILDLGGSEVKYTITENEKSLQIGELGALTVLTYYISRDGEIVTAFATDELVSGRINSLNVEDGKTFVGIEDDEYTVAYDCVDTPEVGYNGVFYINAFGEIVAIEPAIGECEAYAYMFFVNINYDNEEELIINMFTTNGFLETLSFAQRVTINGVPYSNKESIYNALCVSSTGESLSAPAEQPIKYKTNGRGEVIMVDTLATGFGGDDDSFTLDVTKSTLTHEANGVFGCSVAINSETSILYIPENTDEKHEFRLYNAGNFKSDKKYIIEAYNLNETRIAGLVLVYSNENSNTTGIMYIDKTTTIFDENNEIAIQLHGYIDGVYQSVNAVNTEEFASLSRGDVIRYSINRDGYASAYEMWFDASELTAGDAGGSYTSGDFVQYGMVKSTDDVMTLIEIDEQTQRLYSLHAATLYKYNTEEKTLKPAAYQEIKDYLFFGGDASGLFIYTYSASPRSGMIIE